MKILYVATVRSHIGQFHMPFIKKLKELGCTVEAAYRDNSEQKQNLDTSALDKVYEVPFSRSPYSLDNIKAYKVLKRIIDENGYDAVHCHTPMGAVVTRLAARDAKKKGLKVIYTAHGFHFYKGAPTLNWKAYFPIEKYLAKYTDCLITINQEDYDLAKSSNFEAGKIVKVNGVGVDLSEFTQKSDEDKARLREEYGYSQDDFIMIYPADFCKRKNHMMLIKAVEEVVKTHSNVKLLLPGLLDEAQECRDYISEHGLDGYIELLNYRRDIFNLAGLCDISVSSSRQEGLPINLIEAMALGNPIVASDVRGNNDLVQNGVNGYLVELNDSKAMAERIIELIDDPQKVKQMGQAGAELVKKYSVDSVIDEMLEIYRALGLV